MKRILSMLFVAGAASLLSPAASTSWAQSAGALDQEAASVSARLKLVDDLEAGLRWAEAARLRGDCATVEHASSRFYGMRMRILPPEVASDLRRRMKEIAERPCPPVENTPSTAPPMTAPPSPPRQPEGGPVPPTPIGETPPLGDPYQWRWYEERGGDTKTNPAPPHPAPLPVPDDILDEIGDDIGATKTGLPPRPVQPPPEEAPPPDNSAGPQGPRSSDMPPPKAAPPYEDQGEEPPPIVPPSFYLPRLSFQYLQVLFPLTAALDAAIQACDPVAFKAAKNRLLEKIGQLISQSPNDPALLAERRRIEETQLPRPCPPERR